MISACYIVHYGAEWLKWSLRSIIEHVDNVHIFYTPFPSHGHATDLICPESKQDITNSIKGWFNYSDFHWHDCGKFAHEGEHRTFAVETCTQQGADIVLVVDADELWDYDVLHRALIAARNIDMRVFRIGMRHYWRSLKWVCDDQAMPTRIIKPHIQPSDEYYFGDDIGKVHHMGYAQSEAIIKYKMDIHGHKNEWRKEWYEDKFLAWAKGYVDDVHPTNLHYWTPTRVDPATNKELDILCNDHPYRNLEIIT